MSDNVIVSLKDNLKLNDLDLAKQGLSQVLELSPIGDGKFILLRIPSNKNLISIFKKLQKTGYFETIEPNVYANNSSVPNDPYYNNNEHWNLTKIDMEKAWDITTGSSNIIVAVIGGGVDYNHEDLINQLNTNYKGWNYATGTEDPYAFHYHETRCAGIIGASTNINLGVSGIAGGWDGSGIKMMYFQCAPDQWSQPTTANIADAISRARLNGAKVISMSLGGLTNSPALNAQITSAYTNNVVVCVSSGNYERYEDLKTGEWIEEEPVVEYPASLPNVISIGATIESDHRKDWDPDPEVPDWGSCYDGHLSIMAPGINIPSTDLEAYSENKYLNSFLGTSAAAPHVAGVVALMLSVKSDLTVQQIQDILAKSADFYPFMNSDEYGAGRLNAYKALLLALAYDNKSVNDNATATNSGRKVVLDNSGNSHLVFSSGDEIFYRKNNGTWQYPVGLSNNEGENKYPSIAGYSDGSTNRLYVTWQREDTENGDYEIWLAVSSNGGSSWDQFIIDNIEPGTDPKPVIAASCSTNSSVMIAYIDGNSGSVAGLKSKYTTTSIPSSSTSWDTDNISGSNHRNPTLTSFATGSTSYYAIVYETTTYKPELHYRYFSPYGNYWSSSTNLASSYSTGDQHLNPSITVEPGTDNIHVAWEHKFWSGYQREYIAHRKTNQYYYWSSSCNDITHTSAERPTISATSSGATHLIFEAYTDNLYRYTYNGSYWSYSGYVAGSSDHPSLSTGQNSAKYVWTSQSGPQYQINLSSSALSKKMKADPAFYSSRSILLTSEDDSYIQIIQHPVYLSENGTKKLIKMNDFEVDSNSVKLNDLYKLTELKDFMSEDPTAEVEIYYSVKTNDLNSLKKIYRDILGYGNGIRFRTTDASLNNIEPLENEGHYYYDSLSVKIPVSSLKKNYSGNYELGMQLKDFKQHGFKFESVGNIYDYPDDAGLLKEKENAGLASASPQKYQLNLSNYPNPFNPTTLIEYEIPEDAQISIKLYNMLGQMVGELVNTEKAAGRYSVQLDASDLASGVYVYTLSTPKFHASKKMLLIK